MLRKRTLRFVLAGKIMLATPNTHCRNCGQHASTHRMSFRHFVLHDMVHGIFHVDRGIFFTIGHIISRPGQTARAYLAGKRSSSFNLLPLFILCTALSLYLNHFIVDDEAVDRDIEALPEFPDKYVRWVIPSSCFVVGASGFGVFRRARLNYKEPLIPESNRLFRSAGYSEHPLIFLWQRFSWPSIQTLSGIYAVLFPFYQS